MKFFEKIPKKEDEKSKTILEKIRNLKKVGTIAATLSLASMTEGALAGNENKKEGNSEIKKSAPETKGKEKDYVYEIAPNVPDSNKDNFFRKNLPQPEKNIPAGSNKITWKPGKNPERPETLTGGHCSTCPGPENSATTGISNESFGYNNMGGGYGKGAREANRIRERANKMGLSVVDYLLWSNYKTSHDPATRAKAKTLEIKGGKALAEKNTSGEPNDLLVKK